ncbi:MAG: beta-propeller domain-containing protein [Planctomycetales bacterium]|nr:beta-propeller domain-containing protein [Planctomycetales bacterium]
MRTLAITGLVLGLASGCDRGPRKYSLTVQTEVVDASLVPGADLVRYESDTELGDFLAQFPTTNTWAYPGPTSPSSPGSTGPTSPTSASGPAAPTSSTTTVQELGVDESDVVKNDGRYLFIVRGGSLRIVDARPLAGMAEIASFSVPGLGDSLFLLQEAHGGRAVVLSTTSTASGLPLACVTVFDVSDPGNASRIATRFLDGTAVGSRMIGRTLHLVLRNPAYASTWWPFQATTPEGKAAEFLPNLRAAPEDAGREILEATDVLRPATYSRGTNDLSLSTIVSLDVADLDSARAIALADSSTEEYVSTGSLYLSSTTWTAGSNWWTWVTTTRIHKFEFTRDGPFYVGTGTVAGQPLDSYSFNEHRGHLRLAVRDRDSSWSPFTSFYVMRIENARLEVVGSISNIEPGETLFAARYDGDHGFIITAVRSWDPLFTLDLSVPEAPRIVGQFSYDGISTFLAPIGPGQLLAVGQRSVNGFPSGVQISLFDVSNLAAPTRIAFRDVGGNSATSEAVSNPKAFQWYPARNWLSIPVRENGVDRIEVFEVSEAAGIRPLGAMTLGGTIQYWNSWTGSWESWSVNSWVRSVFMEEDVYGVTDNEVSGIPVADLGGTPVRVVLR